MEKVQTGHHVLVHYRGTLPDGTVFDSSYERNEPIHFAVGAGQMIKGFDAAVLDMMVGDKKTVELDPEDAYGHAQEDLIRPIEKAAFGDFSPEIGQRYMMGQYPMKVIEIQEAHIVVDFNHELAWKKLIFDIEVVDIHEHHHH